MHFYSHMEVCPRMLTLATLIFSHYKVLKNDLDNMSVDEPIEIDLLM
jgi:hypothetical protein